MPSMLPVGNFERLRRLQELHPVAVAVEGSGSARGPGSVALRVQSTSKPSAREPGREGLELGDVVEQQRRVGLAGRREGVLHADVDLGGGAPAASYARNQAPPRPGRSSGFSTSVMPRPSAQKRRATSSPPGGQATCTWCSLMTTLPVRQGADPPIVAE